MSQPASVEDLPPPPPMGPRQWLVYLGYVGTWEAVARLPEPLAWRLPAPTGALWHRLASDRQRYQVRMNLQRAAGHPPAAVLDRLVAEAYRSYARYWLDSFRAHRLDPDDVVARTRFEGVEVMDEVVASGQGGILATGHLGSWDIGAFFSNARGWRLTVVAEVVEPRRLFDRFVRLRQRLGMRVVPLVRGGDMVSRLEEVVRGGGTATLLADRDLTGRGPVVEFFGEPCRLPPGAAALARRTGRPVVPGAFLTTPRGWRAVVHEPLQIAGLDIREGTQRVAQALEQLIRNAPEQWHMFQPNWLADRDRQTDRAQTDRDRQRDPRWFADHLPNRTEEGSGA